GIRDDLVTGVQTCALPISPALIIAYIWVWAGFAMVVIAAGLAAIPRDTLEAARTDGATEWQVFRRVTVPLLAPVLTVVFITMLKIGRASCRERGEIMWVDG